MLCTDGDLLVFVVFVSCEWVLYTMDRVFFSSLLWCVSRFRAVVRWRAIANDMLRLTTVCWSHIDGVAVW